MKSITKAQYAMLFFAVDRLKEDSWYTGPYGFDALKERGLVDFGQLDILPRMNAGDSRISRFGFLFATTRQEGRGR